MSSHGIARTVFAVLVLWSLIVLLLPGDALAPSATNDKVGHLLTFAALALAGQWAQVPTRPLLVGLTGYAAATEVLQAVLPINRHGDPRDFLADMAGVLLGLTVGWLLRAAAQAARSPSRPPG